MINIGFRWPEKEDSHYGGPTLKKKKKKEKRIGMNTNSNKLYHVNKLIGWDKLNFTFVHFKKLMKIQFLKYGST